MGKFTSLIGGIFSTAQIRGRYLAEAGMTELLRIEFSVLVSQLLFPIGRPSEGCENWLFVDNTSYHICLLPCLPMTTSHILSHTHTAPSHVLLSIPLRLAVFISVLKASLSLVSLRATFLRARDYFGDWQSEISFFFANSNKRKDISEDYFANFNPEFVTFLFAYACDEGELATRRCNT